MHFKKWSGFFGPPCILKKRISDELAVVRGLMSCVFYICFFSCVSLFYVDYHLVNKDDCLDRDGRCCRELRELQLVMLIIRSCSSSVNCGCLSQHCQWLSPARQTESAKVHL